MYVGLHHARLTEAGLLHAVETAVRRLGHVTTFAALAIAVAVRRSTTADQLLEVTVAQGEPRLQSLLGRISFVMTRA